MKQPSPLRWQEFMHECAERRQRQLASEQARARLRGWSLTVEVIDFYKGKEQS